MTTKTYAEWITADPPVGEREAEFRAMYGSQADQLMDRGTLDLRMAALPPPAEDLPADGGPAVLGTEQTKAEKAAEFKSNTAEDAEIERQLLAEEADKKKRR